MNVQKLQDINQELEELAGRNILGFFKNLLFLNKLTESSSILFPLHEKYLLQGHPINPAENMFVALRNLKDIYNEVRSKTVKVWYQYDQLENKEEKPVVQLPLQILPKNQGTDNYDHASVQETSVYSTMKPKPRELDQFPGIQYREGKSQDKSYRGVNSRPSEHDLSSMPKYSNHEGNQMFSLRSIYVDNPSNAKDQSDRSEKLLDYGLKILDVKFNEEIKRIVKVDDESLTQIIATYRTENSELKKNLLKSLSTSSSVRTSIVLSLKNISIFEVMSEKDKNEKYPLSKYFKATIWNNLKKYPEETVRNYFGDKVAIYFGFLNYFRDKLNWISLLGIGVTALKTAFYVRKQGDTNRQFGVNISNISAIELLYDISIVAFCIAVPIWCKTFEIGWNNYEKEFGVKYGSSDDKDNTYENIRPEFKGVWTRSVADDRMNSTEEHQSNKRGIYYLLATFVIVLASLCGLSSYYILLAKRTAFDENWLNYKNRVERPSEYASAIEGEKQETINVAYFDPNEILFNIAEVIKIYIFQYVFALIIKKLVRYENLKFKKDHENQLILFLSMFQLMNNSFMILIVAYQSLFSGTVEISDDGETYFITKSGCLREECDQELSNFFLVYCLVQLFLVLIVRFILYRITATILKVTRNAAKAAKGFIKSTNSRLRNSLNLTKMKSLKPMADGKSSPRSELKKKIASFALFNIEKMANDEMNQIGQDAIDDVVEKYYLTSQKYHIEENRLDKIKNKELIKEKKKNRGLQGDMKNQPDKPQNEIDLNIPSSSDSDDESPDNIKDNKLGSKKKHEKEKDYKMYQQINEEIDRQVTLEGKETGADYDPNLEDYLQLYNVYAYTTLYGGLLPLSFLVALLTGIIEALIDTQDISTKKRRPIPQSTSTIGLWNDIIGLTSQLSILTNSFYVAFIVLEEREAYVKFVTFLVLFISIVVVSTVFSNLASGLKKSTQVSIQRSEYIKNLLFTSFSRKDGRSDTKTFKTTDRKFGEIEIPKRTDALLSLYDGEQDIEKFKDEEQSKLTAILIGKLSVQSQRQYRIDNPGYFKNTSNITRQGDQVDIQNHRKDSYYTTPRSAKSRDNSIDMSLNPASLHNQQNQPAYHSQTTPQFTPTSVYVDGDAAEHRPTFTAE